MLRENCTTKGKTTVFIERILKKTSLQFENDYWEVDITCTLQTRKLRWQTGLRWPMAFNKQKKPSFWQVCITRTHSLSIIFWETLYTAHLSTLTTRNCFFSLFWWMYVMYMMYAYYYYTECIYLCTGVRINSTV